jgi:hypothetical protein
MSTTSAPTYSLIQYLARQLQGYLGNSPHHMKNTKDFIYTLKSLCASRKEILISFDVTTLLIMVSTGNVPYLLDWHSDEDVLRLFSSLLWFNGQQYKQTDGVVMSSPLSPVSSNFFMQHFKENSPVMGDTQADGLAGFAAWMTHSSSGPIVWASCQSSLTT